MNVDAMKKCVPSETLANAADSRAEYEAPKLTLLGDLRALTLGGSIGATESGPGGLTRKPSGT